MGYFLLVGRHIFEATTTVEVLSNHVHSRPVPPSERLGRALPGDLERILLACLEKDPDDRPPSAVALEAMLSGCADAGSWTQSAARARPSPPRAKRRAPTTGGETVAIDPHRRDPV